jgi:fumarate reductase subunit C
VLAPETIEALARAERRHDRSRVAALWVIAALLAVVVLVLLFG